MPEAREAARMQELLMQEGAKAITCAEEQDEICQGKPPMAVDELDSGHIAKESWLRAANRRWPLTPPPALWRDSH